MDNGVIILPTISIKVKAKKDWVEAVALLDSGSSKSYISRRLVKRCNPKWLRRTEANSAIFGGLKMKSQRDEFEVVVEDLEGERKFHLTEVPVICAPLSRPEVHSDSLKSFDHLHVINDFRSQGSVVIDILIGLDLYWEVVKAGVFKPEEGEVVAQETIFGWVLSGCRLECSPDRAPSPSLLSMEDIPEELEHCFWDLDSIGVGEVEPVNRVIEEFVDNIRFVEEESRYEVGLTYKSELQRPELKNNFAVASRLNQSLERRLGKDPEMQERYNSAGREMEQLDFIEEVPKAEIRCKDGSTFYLPHHPHSREDSLTTKIRPVFNASIKGPNVFSLNDCLESGPNLNPTVMEVLLRFRRWPVALSADITKAFLQILLREEDRCSPFPVECRW
jgi:hypothetical protein